MIDRRQFVGASLGLGAGFTLPTWLRADAAGQSLPFILVVYASGGWDTTMVFDNQLGSTYVTNEPGAKASDASAPIAYVDHVDRPAVKSFFQAYGSSAAIVNGISTGSMDRRSGLGNVLSFTPPGKSRPTDWLSYFVATMNPVMDMPHAVIDAPFIPGDYASVAVRLGKRAIAEHIDGVPGDDLGTSGEKALENFRVNAYGAAQKGISPASLDGEKMRALFYANARESTITTRIKEATDTLGSQGGESDFLRNAKMAVEFFANGASQCATVQAGPTDLWDTSTDHYAKQTANYQSLFTDLHSLFDYAETRSVLSRMLVVVMSERSRAPRFNAQDRKGAWPTTSAMLWGMGIQGGKVVSASDDALRSIPINPILGIPGVGTQVTLTMANVFSAIYLLFNAPYQFAMPGIDPLTPILSSKT